jgi:hypothetical protein
VVVTHKKKGEKSGGEIQGEIMGDKKNNNIKKALNLINLNRPPPLSHVSPHLLY